MATCVWCRRCGHATLGTMMIYTEITDRRKRDAYVRLGDYLHDVTVRVDGMRP